MSRFQVVETVGAKPIECVVHSSGADAVTIPDVHLLFSGAYKRVGPDLLIEGGGKCALLQDYFAHEHGATLLSPNGARLEPDTVRALAGQDSSWQVAQAGAGSVPPEIGTVRTLSGTASVQRGGAQQPLASGEPIFQGDVVETGAGSSLGIILRDSTVFSLSAGARMVMNQLVYDPGRTDNSMAINLVQGTFVFITGQVAKTGSVAITTPVATMGIRGTMPIVKLTQNGDSGEFGIAADPPVPGGPASGSVGIYTLTLPSGLQTTVASTDVVVRISNAATFDIGTKSVAEQLSDQQIVAPAYQVYSLLGQRGDVPSPFQQANNTAKGQGAVGFQYAFAIVNQHELATTQLLDNTVLERDAFDDGTRTFQDVLRQVVVGGPLGLDLDIATPGVNRQATFVENADGLPVTSAPQIIIPTNATQLTGATIVLQNQLAGDGLLVGALPPGITVSVTFGSIHITLTGVASAADYIAAIQAIRFINTSDNPATDVRVIEVTVTSIDGQTATATTFVTIEAINDPPVNHLPAAQTTAEDAAHVFSTANGNAITVTDADAGSQPITTTLSVQHGALAITAAIIASTGVTVVGNGTGTLVVTGSQDAINAALDGLAYTANSDFHGNDAIVVSTTDNGATGSGGSLTTISVGLGITVTSVNDAPQGADKTIATLEDKPVILTTADFGFTDPHDSPANHLLAVQITTLPGNGELTLNGYAVAAGDFVSAAAIAAGKLVWTPGGDDHGNGLASLEFKVQDDGGTANNGVDLDQSANTITFNVASVNDAPDGADKILTTNEDTSITLKVADFGFSDPHDAAAPNHLLAVQITTLPVTGALKLNGYAVSEGQFVSAADIAANKLVWTPSDDEHDEGLASFTFKVQDDGGTANGGVNLDPTANTITFNVTSVNDAPQGADKTLTTDEDTSITLTIADFGFTDTHDAAAPNHILAVKITTLPGNGALTLNGYAVSNGQFVSAADIAANKLVWTPSDDEHDEGLASFTFKVQDDGGTANGGVNLDPTANTITFNVASVNDAPDGADKILTTNEDTAVTLKIANFGFTDTHDGAGNNLLAVKITTLPGNGALTFDGHAVAAGALVLATDIAAGKLVWAPNEDAHDDGLATFKFQVQDDGGTANGGSNLDPTANTITFNVKEVNDAPDGANRAATTLEDQAFTLSVANFGFADPHDGAGNNFLAVKIAALPGNGMLTDNGIAVTAGDIVTVADITAGHLVWMPGHDANGTGLANLAFQVMDDGGTANGGANLDPSPNILTFNVTAVNDAPVAHNDAYTTNEDQKLTISAVGVLGNDSDIDSAALTAVLVTGPAHGTLTLDATGAFIYTPNHDYNGTDSFTYKANDGTANSNIATVDLTISSVNDAPVNTVPGSQHIDDDHSSLTFSRANGNAISILDVDAGSVDMQVTLTVGHGTLNVGAHPASVIVTLNGTGAVTLTGSQAGINAALDGLRYQSSHDFSGVDQLTIVTSDLGHSGSGGPLNDTDTIRITVEGDDHHHSAQSVQSAGLASLSAGNTFIGIGSAVDVVDFSAPAFANITTVAFRADAPLDTTYAVDILSSFDSATRQIDLSGIFGSQPGGGAVNGGNIGSFVHVIDQGGGKVDVLVDPDGASGSGSAVKVASITGTAGADHHALGASAGDVIAVIFDQVQPAAHVGITHA
jgi:VCBS repeat-containing protein